MIYLHFSKQSFSATIDALMVMSCPKSFPENSSEPLFGQESVLKPNIPTPTPARRERGATLIRHSPDSAWLLTHTAFRAPISLSTGKGSMSPPNSTASTVEIGFAQAVSREIVLFATAVASREFREGCGPAPVVEGPRPAAPVSISAVGPYAARASGISALSGHRYPVDSQSIARYRLPAVLPLIRAIV
jgi:hypothetical protein